MALWNIYLNPLPIYKWIFVLWVVGVLYILWIQVCNTHQMLLLLSRFSHVRFCVTPWTTAHQVPPSLGFSRQEHWSGLPSPSPMHESKKWKWSCSVVSDSSWPHGLQPTRLLRPWAFPGKSTGVGHYCLVQHIRYMDLNISSQSYLAFLFC